MSVELKGIIKVILRTVLIIIVSLLSISFLLGQVNLISIYSIGLSVSAMNFITGGVILEKRIYSNKKIFNYIFILIYILKVLLVLIISYIFMFNLKMFLAYIIGFASFYLILILTYIKNKGGIDNGTF